MTTLKIRELDLNNIRPKDVSDVKGGGRYIAIGAPGSGKSSVMKAICYSKKHFIPVGNVFSGTEDSNEFFSSWVPDTFIFNGIDEDLNQIEKFEKRQKIAHKYLEKQGYNPWCFQIIDDCTADNKFLKKPIIKSIYKNGRHWRILHILSLQYAVDIDASIRTCVDGVFIFRETRADMREKLFKYYASCVPSLDVFNQIMDKLTENYTCIFIDYRAQSNNMEDCIYYYKADLNKIPKDWKMGSKEYWDYHYERFDKNSKN